MAWVLKHAKEKKYLVSCSIVLCCCRIWSTREILFDNIFLQENEALFSVAEEIFGRTLKKRASHIYYTDLAKETEKM